MNRFTKVATEADKAAGIKEARKRLRKKLGHEYSAWREVKRDDGLYHCACKPGCKQGVYAYGGISSKCRDLIVWDRARRMKQGEAA